MRQSGLVFEIWPFKSAIIISLPLLGETFLGYSCHKMIRKKRIGVACGTLECRPA
jgi:hypothetical protein